MSLSAPLLNARTGAGLRNVQARLMASGHVAHATARASQKKTLRQDLAESPLGSYLVEQVAWRHMSAATMAKICSLALDELVKVVSVVAKDEPNPADLAHSLAPALAALGKLGQQGDRADNANAYLEARLDIPTLPLSSFSLPVILPGKKVFQHETQKAIWPHKMVHSLWNAADNCGFTKRICSGPERLRTFWAAQKDHPNLPTMRYHCRDILDWESKAIPIKVYGDGTPITGVGKAWSKSADSYTWSSQVGTGRSAQSVFLIWGIVNKLVHSSKIGTADTKKCFWKRLAHALKSMWCGEFLDHDENGKQYDPLTPLGKLAGTKLCGDSGYFFVIWLLAGDLEWFYKDLVSSWKPEAPNSFGTPAHSKVIQYLPAKLVWPPADMKLPFNMNL